MMLLLLLLLREERVVEVLILVQRAVQYRPVSWTPLSSYWRAIIVTETSHALVTVTKTSATILW